MLTANFRFDGVEQFGMLVSTLLSPLAFRFLNYPGTFALSAAASSLALVYLIFVVKEPLEPIKTEDKGTILDFVKNNVLEPFKQTLKTVFKRRENGLRLLILLSLFTYCIYWSLVTFNQMIYLYLSKVFEGFDGRDNAIYLAYLRVLGMISLFVIMPIISKRLQVH